jgi:predicted DCC family thiol-disulfide oxidoreductase YuxK
VNPDGPVLLYDGTCGFCAQSVQFVLKHDRQRDLRFAPLQGVFARDVLVRHPELADADSIVWVEATPGDARSETVLTQSAAAIRIAAYLGGRWRIAMLAKLVPGPLRDAVYRLVAKHRHRLTRGGPECLVPTPEQRTRFLS